MGSLLRTIGLGALAGAGLCGLLVIWELVSQGFFIGYRAGLVGIITGGISMTLALLMSLTSYQLAKRERSATLRKRLLAAAIWTGAVGLSCGLTSAMLWVITARTF